MKLLAPNADILKFIMMKNTQNRNILLGVVKIEVIAKYKIIQDKKVVRCDQEYSGLQANIPDKSTKKVKIINNLSIIENPSARCLVTKILETNKKRETSPYGIISITGCIWCSRMYSTKMYRQRNQSAALSDRKLFARARKWNAVSSGSRIHPGLFFLSISFLRIFQYIMLACLCRLRSCK